VRCAGTCVISRAMGTGLLVPKPCAILGERGTLADGEYRRRVIAARYSISCCRCRRARTVRPCAMLRAILRRSSSENGRAYVFAAHDDEAHPHVHQSLQVRGPDGRRLNPRRQDLRRWRERFAEQLRAHGVEANATARRTRVSRSVTRTRASRICWRVTRCRCTGGPSQMRSSDRQDGSLMMAHLPRRGK